MVKIKTKQSWKDFATKCDHPHLTRRDFLKRGMTTGAMSLVLPKIIMGDMIGNAMAAACPAAIKNKGAIAQIFAEGGPTMGARFFSDQQAQIVASSTAAAANYGVNGQKIVRIGQNLNVSSSSPFGATLLAGPTGYTAAEWAAVLAKTSGAGHYGAFNADDGAGQDTGLLGRVSPFKSSQMNKDIAISNSNKLAVWANGLPSASASLNGLAPASLAKIFSMTPAGLTNATTILNTQKAAQSLSGIFSDMFGMGARKGADSVLTAANCGFSGTSALADPTYGTNLFTPANIPALSGKLTLGSLTGSELAHLAAYYRSADGTAGGVFTEFGGRDYHGNNVQTDISPKDIEEARAIVMFLAACDIAQSKGAMIYLSNGQAIASGIQTGVTATVNGTTAATALTLDGPVASGDAGGAYNGGLILFFDPAGAPPVTKVTGTFDSSSGNVKAATVANSTNEAVAGLYLSALAHIGADVGGATLRMKKLGIAANPAGIMLI